jgi:hypothetical protein
MDQHRLTTNHAGIENPLYLASRVGVAAAPEPIRSPTTTRPVARHTRDALILFSSRQPPPTLGARCSFRPRGVLRAATPLTEPTMRVVRACDVQRGVQQLAQPGRARLSLILDVLARKFVSINLSSAAGLAKFLDTRRQILLNSAVEAVFPTRLKAVAKNNSRRTRAVIGYCEPESGGGWRTHRIRHRLNTLASSAMNKP